MPRRRANPDSFGSSPPATGRPAAGRRPWLIWGGAGLAVAAAVVFGIVALMAGLDGGPPGFAKADGEPVFAGLDSRADQVTTVEIGAGDRELTLQKTDDGWRLAEFGGFPVVDEAVEELIREMAALKAVYVSEGTDPPYAQLGISEPFGPGDTAPRVTLRDAAGEVLATAQVGKTITSVPGGAQISKVLVRRQEDGPVWLVDGEFHVSAAPLNWVERDVMTLPGPLVEEMTVTAPDGQEMVIRRNADGELDAVEGMPAGAGEPDLEALQLMAGALAMVQLEGLRAADPLVNGGETPWRVAIRSADGMLYRVQLFGERGSAWAVLAAEARKDAEPAAAEAQAVPGSTAAKAAVARGDADKRAEEFNRRHAGRAYLLPDYSAERLMVRPADLIGGPAPSVAESPSPAPAAAPSQ